MSANRFVILILIGLITLAVVFVVKRPELVQDFWMWMLGLAAPIIRVARLLWNVLEQRILQISAWVKKGETQLKASATSLTKKSSNNCSTEDENILG